MDREEMKERSRKTRERRALYVGVGMLALFAVVASASLIWKRPGEEGMKVRAVKVAERTVVSRVLSQGKIRARRQVDVGSEIAGRVRGVFVEEGQQVQPGDPLFALDDEQYKNAVAQLKVALKASKAMLDRAEIMLEEQKRGVERDSRLGKSGLIAADVVASGKNRVPLAEADVSQARAGLERTRLDLSRAEDALKKTQVVAPIAGTVVSVPIEVGQVITPSMTSGDSLGGGGLGGLSSMSSASLGQSIVIADLSELVAELEVDELDVGQVKTGQPVSLTTQGARKEAFAGVVEQVGLLGRDSGGAVVFEVRASVTDPATVAAEGSPEVGTADITLRPGMSVSADIEVGRLERALVVPIAAVLEGEGQAGGKPDRVFLTDRGVAGTTAVEREVSLGPSDAEVVAVLAGLALGDEIVEGPYRALRELEDKGAITVEQVVELPPPEASAP